MVATLRGLALAFLLLALGLPLRADYLKNSDLKDSLAGWHGDGQRVLLLPDGTEGAETDPGAVPVIKLKLGHNSAGVYQNYQTRDHPRELRISFSIYPSDDFKRTPSEGGYYNDAFISGADFWARDQPTWWLKTVSPKRGKWVTVKEMVHVASGVVDHCLSFSVPPGQGAIYVKDPHVEK